MERVFDQSGSGIDTPASHTEPVDLDVLRAVFREAMREYMRQGAAMCNLLRQSERDPEQIANQQQSLNSARAQYELARSRYVCAVLGEFTVAPTGGDTNKGRTIPDQH